MEDLTIEEKAKAYDEALKRAKAMIKIADNQDEAKSFAKTIFPELVESEDERIMERIYNYINVTLDDNESVEKEKWLAWLERQGDKDKLIQELGEYKVKYTQEVLEKHINSMSNKDDERLRKTTIAFLKDFAEQGYENAIECINWLEKQESVEEIVSRCKTSWYNEGKIQGQIEGLSDEEKYQQGWHNALEKQGEKEQKSLTWKHWKDGIAGGSEGEQIFLIKNGLHYSISSCLGYECDYIELSELDKLLSEKQGKQKVSVVDFKAKDWYASKVDGKIHNMTYNSIDKVEPKFKVGDWIISAKAHEDYRICKITNIDNGYYTIESIYGYKGYNHFNVFEESYRLWTIQDAKDGDVLATKSGRPFIFKCFDKFHSGCPVAYCGIDDIDDFIVGSGNHWWTGEEVQPATKEQRDLLFQNMKEAGYEWDDDKKELLEIKEELTDFENSLKHIMIETLECGDTRNLKADAEMLLRIAQKPKEWSEEDEKKLKRLIHICEDNLEMFDYTGINDDIDESLIHWLKSLKERMGG